MVAGSSVTTRAKLRRRNEAGQGMLEYILVTVLIAVAGIAAWRLFGNRVQAAITGTGLQVESQVCSGLTGNAKKQCEKW